MPNSEILKNRILKVIENLLKIQRNLKKIFKESSVNLDNNDNNNEINTDNLFNSLGFNNSFEMKEEENDCEQQALASSPLTPENENNKGEGLEILKYKF